MTGTKHMSNQAYLWDLGKNEIGRKLVVDFDLW